MCYYIFKIKENLKMKLTRMFILKAFDEDYKNFDNNEPANSLKNLIITNSNIDKIILLILSFLYVISIGFIDSSFYDKYPINFLFVSKFILFISILFFLIESFRITMIVWEKYLRALNKPQESSPRNSNGSCLSTLSKNRIEMDDIDDIKNPFLNEDNNNDNDKEENKYDINENVKNKIINNKKNYIEIHYEQILLDPLTTFYDKIFIKLYIYLINKLENYLAKNEKSMDNKLNEFSLYKIIIKYPHTLSSIIHFIKFLLFMFSFGFSFLFWVLYVPNKMQLNKYSFNVINVFIGECLSLYCLFRLCYFLLRFIVSFIISPIYLSSLYLGYYEDKMNEKLNELINTRIYIDENSLISRDSLNKLKKDEILTSCSICLENYIKGDVISTLPCSKRHTFHSYCLEEWFFSNIVCPLCRYDFSKEFGTLFSDNNNNNQEEINNENNFIQNIINNINNNININNINNINNNEQQENNNIINNNNINNNAENPVQNIEMNELNINLNNNINNNNENNNNAGNNINH